MLTNDDIIIDKYDDVILMLYVLLYIALCIALQAWGILYFGRYVIIEHTTVSTAGLNDAYSHG